MTDSAIIAASYAAERNYSHNPDDVIDASDAVGAWGTAKESTTELSDLSGNGNIADIHGAMPAEGFIQGRRFTAANLNYLDCGNDSSLNITGPITFEGIIDANGLAGLYNIISNNHSSAFGYEIYITALGAIGYKTSQAGANQISTTANGEITINALYHIIVERNGTSSKIYINGVDKTSIYGSHVDPVSSSYPLRIGTYRSISNFFNGLFIFANIKTNLLSVKEKEQQFNTLARLLFWSVNYTDYPDNVTTYTDRLPHSSSIISSGTFKVDDDKLQCVSAGTMTYSASYNFDGSEYIKVKISDVEYAGTGTITQGNTTVSVAQGSNKVTIEMGTGDTIDSIIVQFRAEV